MKNKVLLIIALFSVNAIFAQFYVSGNVGYSISSAGTLTGTSLNESQTKATNHYGSYGEGMNVQLRGGYFFNEMFGVELGIAYLHGADQNISSYVADGSTILEYTDGTAHARAYGLTAALTYNFNEHFYGKIGMITKLGGKTEAEFTQTTLTPFGSPIVAKGVNDYHGRFPLGFTASFGYKYKIAENWNVFAELEYLGINVTRNTSEFSKLTIDYPAIPEGAIPGVPGIPAMTWNLGDEPHPIFGAPETDIKYVDSLPVPNDDPKKELSSVAPYSSFGLNIGITYTFSQKEKS